MKLFRYMLLCLWMVVVTCTIKPAHMSGVCIQTTVNKQTNQKINKLAHRFVMVGKLIKGLDSHIDQQVLSSIDLQRIKKGQFAFEKILDNCNAMIKRASELNAQVDNVDQHCAHQGLHLAELSVLMLEGCYQSFMQMLMKMELLSLGEHEIGEATLLEKPLSHGQLQHLLSKVYFQLSECCSKYVTRLANGCFEEPIFFIDFEALLPERLQPAWYKLSLLQQPDSLNALLQTDFYADNHLLFKRYLLIMKHLNKVNLSRNVIEQHNIPAQLTLLIQDFQDCVFNLSQQKHKSLSRADRKKVMQTHRVMSFYCARLQLVKTEIDQLLNYNPTPELGFVYMKHQLVKKDYDVYSYLKKFNTVALYHRYMRLVETVLYSDSANQSLYYDLYALIDDLKRIKEKNQPNLVKQYLGLENKSRSNFFNSVDRLIEVLTMLAGTISKKIGKQLPAGLVEQGGVGSGDIVGHVKQWLGEQQSQYIKSLSLKTLAIASPFLAAGLAKYVSLHVTDETKKKIAKSIAAFIYHNHEKSTQAADLAELLKNDADLAKKVQEELDKASDQDDDK